MAMLVVTIATIIAVELAWDTNLDLRRTEGVMAWDEARQIAYAVETYAAHEIGGDTDKETGEPANFTRDDDEFCLKQTVSIPLDLAEGQTGGMVGNRCDLQGRFNLNNLIVAGKRDELAAKQFVRLIRAVRSIYQYVDFGDTTPETIVDSTIDWIDPDTDTQPDGAEDDYYTSLQVPYRAANTWFTDISEFSAVRGVSPAIYRALAPFIAALPYERGRSRTLINVNTALVPVLMSLGDDITQENAEGWCLDGREGIKDVATAFSKYMDPAMVPYVGLRTDYFELRGTVSIGTTRLGMYSLLERVGTGFLPRLRQFDVVDMAEPEPASEESDAKASDAEAKAKAKAKADQTDYDEMSGIQVASAGNDINVICYPRDPT